MNKHLSHLTSRAALLGCLICTAGNAALGFAEDPNEFGFAAGYVYPIDGTDGLISGELRYNYWFDQNVSLAITLGAGLGDAAGIALAGIGGDYAFAPVSDGLTPYVGLLGVYGISINEDDTEDAEELSDFSAFGIEGHAGLKQEISDSVVIDYRLSYLFLDGSNIVTGSIGVGFLF